MRKLRSALLPSAPESAMALPPSPTVVASIGRLSAAIAVLLLATWHVSVTWLLHEIASCVTIFFHEVRELGTAYSLHKKRQIPN